MSSKSKKNSPVIAKEVANDPAVTSEITMPAALTKATATVLEGLEIVELNAVIEYAGRLMLDRKEKQKAALTNQFAEMAAKAGLTVEELLGKRKGKHIPIKFRDPNGNEWTGRGKKPQWVEDLVANGGDLEQYRIAPDSDYAQKKKAKAAAQAA